MTSNNIKHRDRYSLQLVCNLESDIIHLKRCDGASFDGILHADPTGKREKGMLVLYNSTSNALELTVDVPVYYTGLHERVTISEKDEKPETMKVSRDYGVSLKVTLKPNSMTWFTLR